MDKKQGVGAPASQDGLSQAEPEVSALRASIPSGVARCQPSDVFTISGSPDEKILGPLRDYFATFAAPTGGDAQLCVGCGKEFDGFKQMMGLGAVAHEWDLTHGEARCTGCGWPSRGVHYIKDSEGEEIATIRNYFLQYHPDEVAAGDGK